ncbi:MAG: oligosaccharide flippase family protein [Eubacteriales bacterium]
MTHSRTFIKGAILLSIAGIITKILSMLFRIPLHYLTGDEGFGYYQTFYSVYMLLVAIALIGMPQAVSKVVSESTARKNEEDAYAYFKAALYSLTTIGIIVTLCLIFGAKLLINLSGWSQNNIYVIYGLSISPLFICIAGSFKGYYQGKQMMGPTSLTQIIEGFTKVVLGFALTILLKNLGYGPPVAVGGAAFGTTLGYILSCIFLIYIWKKRVRFKKNHKKLKKSYIVKLSKQLLKIAIPITIGASAYSVMNFIDSFTIFNRLKVMGIIAEEATLINGQIGKTFTIINVPLTLSVALMISTVPAVAWAKEKKNKKNLLESINTSIRLSLMLALPSAIGLGILANPLLKLIYPRSSSGFEYLQLYSICLVFLIIGQALASVLQGLGYYMIPIWTLMISSITKIIVNYFLIASPLLGKGALYGSIAFYAIFTVLNYIILVRIIKNKIISIKGLLKPLTSSVLMGIIVFVIFNYSTPIIGSKLSTVLSVCFGGIFYVLFLFLTKSITEDDLKILPRHNKIIKFLKMLRLL